MREIIHLQENELYMVCDGETGYAKIPNILVDDWAQVIGAYGVAVYVFIARRQGGNGYGYPSIPDIAAHLGISRRKTISVISDLENNGLIRVLHARGRVSRYAIAYPVPKRLEKIEPETPTSAPHALVHDMHQCTTCTTPVHHVHYTSAPRAPVSINKKYKQEEETYILSKSRRREKKDQFDQQAESVLRHLNSQVGRKFRETGKIPARLRAGATVADCCLVIDYLAATWSAEFREKYLNHTSPFRAEKFEVNLSNAQAWSAKRMGGDNGLKVVL